MCVTTSQAELSSTIGFTTKWGDETILVYGNDIENLSEKQNSMLLHIPCENIDDIKLLSSEGYSNFGKDGLQID